MIATVDTQTLSIEPLEAITSTAATDDTLGVKARFLSNNHDAWQSVIDMKLNEWGIDPNQLEEEELIPPTRTAIRKAVKLAQAFQNDDWPPPMRVVPDGDGGVVFERWSGSISVSIEIDKNGESEFVECCDNKVTSRVRIS